MTRQIIQVPVEESLLNALNAASKKRRQSRSEFIREACQQQLKQVELEQMDEIYRKGYEQQPEEPALGQAQATLAGHVLSREVW